MSTQSLKINGPINVVRMEGQINDIHKVIYIFMDEHLNLSDQTDCADPENSMHIVDYLKKNFENLQNENKTYDFFLETFPDTLAYGTEELTYSTIPDSERTYIENLWKFFYDHVKFDKKTNTLSSLFKNTRLHYIDIRNILYPFLVEPLEFSIEQINQKHNLVYEMVTTSLEVIIDFMKLVEIILETNEFDGTNKKQIIGKLENNIVDFLLKPEIRLEYQEQVLF
ncbi:hypothetical protein QJ856_gp0338 [Tupanvirus deep ocean]|uniref:Uncharacterized protein n=2 Tax=Tupanvirus TaxID=2094720 RepID=A0AC62A9P0_9VIRU|nr:hypothetical protein QJ856_gp0338 [Tupanvirus deep ocean]QKU34398.1 hypothetical protein [Tupanvirus deep ocean]